MTSLVMSMVLSTLALLIAVILLLDRLWFSKRVRLTCEVWRLNGLVLCNHTHFVLRVDYVGLGTSREEIVSPATASLVFGTDADDKFFSKPFEPLEFIKTMKGMLIIPPRGKVHLELEPHDFLPNLDCVYVHLESYDRFWKFNLPTDSLEQLKELRSEQNAAEGLNAKNNGMR